MFDREIDCLNTVLRRYAMEASAPGQASQRGLAGKSVLGDENS
jgi:hypothetical protein